MWSTFLACKVFMPPNFGDQVLFKGAVFLNIEDEVVWNPMGCKLPTVDHWVWGVPETHSFINYIGSLTEHGFIPILWSKSIGLEAVFDQVQASLNSPIPAFCGVTPDVLRSWITLHWRDVKGSFPGCSTIRLQESFSVYSINGDYGDVKCRFEDLKYTVETRVPKKPSLIVLMGQQGSGKSTVAQKLAMLGYIVYNEKESGAIRNKQVKATALFKESLQKLLAPDASNAAGIVIDATNPTIASRLVYIDIAKALGVPFHVGWITRPGYKSNAARVIAVPSMVLGMYKNKVESPVASENPIRLI